MILNYGYTLEIPRELVFFKSNTLVLSIKSESQASIFNEKAPLVVLVHGQG